LARRECNRIYKTPDTFCMTWQNSRPTTLV
jgi:hypothetical protein